MIRPRELRLQGQSPPPINKGTTIQGVVAGFAALACIVVALRFWTRVKIIRSVGADDWLILAATINLVASAVTDGLVVEYYNTGINHWEDIDNQYETLAIKLDFANQLLYHPILSLSRISILLFYLRLSVSGSFRWCVKIFIGLNIALMVAVVLANLFQCTPVNHLWNKTIPGMCFDQKTFFITCSFINISMDLAVLVLPVRMVWNLKVNFRKKTALVALFGLGTFVCAISIVRLDALFYVYEKIGLRKRDVMQAYSTGYLWSGIECSAAIICASAPSLNPFFSRHFPKLLNSTSGAHYGGRTHANSRSRGYALGPLQCTHQPSAPILVPQSKVQPHSKTTIIRGDNESEEMIIHRGILRTMNVSVEVESIHTSIEDRSDAGRTRN